MGRRKGSVKENIEEARKVFFDAGLHEFCEFGYASASTSRIVKTSGMARGSLYYHFGDKQGLFTAIYESMMFDALNTVSKTMDAESDPWDSFMCGSMAFMDLCVEPKFRKIVLVESQSALPLEARISIQHKTLLGKLRSILNELLDNGYFTGHSIDTISVFIYGIITEIGRSMDYAEDVYIAKDMFQKSFKETLVRMGK